MYPKICPICKEPEQYAGRGFEHISMYLGGQGRGTLHLRCMRCHATFAWEYGEAQHIAPEPAVGEGKNKSRTAANGSVGKITTAK